MLFRSSNSKANNDILIFNSGLVNDPVIDMFLSQNNFDYTENVQAVYISGRNLSKSTSLRHLHTLLRPSTDTCSDIFSQQRPMVNYCVL